MTAHQQVLHVAGWQTCGFYKRTMNVVSSLSLLFPSKLKIIEHSFQSRDAYRQWLIDEGFRTRFSDIRAEKHTSSPFSWITETDEADIHVSQLRGSDKKTNVPGFVGGCDDTLDWCRKFCAPSKNDNISNGSAQIKSMVDDGHSQSKDKNYDYDLVVLGGGSGGLAASKKASELGANVAVLDFVKPSTHGTSWGLGGTCVNVGCIPKKLMHTAATIKDMMQKDASSFGIMNQQPLNHSWETMRENIQNHIKGLNFKYRVNLREKEVTYLNKLGRFIDAHTLELTDKKGKTSTITSSRFIVAVGGRPSILDCEGGHLAISSDDIFSLKKSPEKTLCIGASYISLECAGFLAGLGYDTTVAVRSILLRGFDRQCADLIGTYMEDHGVTFKHSVTPMKLEKLDSGKIQVTFSDDSVDVYDTVLCAIGRQADTDTLGLDTINVQTNPKNKKIITLLEQTSCPNVYAIGDVMEGCPELTPVAIQAGQILSRRLFSESTETMDYKNICTTVFTPIEYATVGYSEEDAEQTFGKDNLVVYHKEFTPLEWSLTYSRSHHSAFTKVICDKNDNMTIVGIHYLGPNAGEVMQGYGVAIKKGLTFQNLEDTVGIHPTSSEEIVTLSITKASGESAAAGGC